MFICGRRDGSNDLEREVIHVTVHPSTHQEPTSSDEGVEVEGRMARGEKAKERGTKQARPAKQASSFRILALDPSYQFDHS